MTYEDMSTAPRDGSQLLLRTVRDPSFAVKARWVDGKWIYERKDGIEILVTDGAFDGWRQA